MLQHKDEVLERIRQRLYWDKRISMIDVHVEEGVAPGSVVVFGAVDSTFKQEAALELVRNTEGVLAVEDRLAVHFGLHRSDDTLKAIIESELREVPWQKGEAVHVVVFGGVVKLTGTVYRKRTKAMAAGFCWELSGVRDCLNHILLSDAPPVAEAQAEVILRDILDVPPAEGDEPHWGEPLRDGPSPQATA
jgi:osmotically-inducible protein OsmY